MASVRKNSGKAIDDLPTVHYDLGRWIDFARGLEPAQEASNMVAHAESCAECRDAMTFCQKLTAVARCAMPPKTHTNSGVS